MSWLKKKWIAAFACCSLLSVGLIYGVLAVCVQHARISPVDKMESKPIGLILEGKVFSQIVDLPEFEEEVDHALSVGYANYKNRFEGELWIRLKQDSVIEDYRFDVSTLSDSEKLYLKLDSMRFHAGEAVVEIRGVGFDSSASPTLWGYSSVTDHELLLNGMGTGMELKVAFFRQGSCLKLLGMVLGGKILVLGLVVSIGGVIGSILSALFCVIVHSRS